jgi:hypothetical protein
VVSPRSRARKKRLGDPRHRYVPTQRALGIPRRPGHRSHVDCSQSTTPAGLQRAGRLSTLSSKTSWAERSTNWRVKSEDRPPPQQGQDRRAWREGGQGRQQQAQYQGRSGPVRNAQWMNDSSTTKDDPQAQQAMAEGRRLYVGNMPYMAKTEDVDTLFQSEEYKV